MDAYYFWQSKEFNLMNVFSPLSLSFNTSVENIYIYYDAGDHPQNIYWKMLQFIPRVILAPVHNKYKSLAHIDKPTSMEEVFKHSILMNFVFMNQVSGYAASFDSYFTRDICEIKTTKPFFGNGEIYFGLLLFREKKCIIKRIMKKIVKAKYNYEQLEEFIKKKFKNSRNMDVIWKHDRKDKYNKQKYVVDFGASEGFKLFDQDDFELFLNEDLLADIKNMLNKCKKTNEYFQIASVIHL